MENTHTSTAQRAPRTWSIELMRFDHASNDYVAHKHEINLDLENAMEMLRVWSNEISGPSGKLAVDSFERFDALFRAKVGTGPNRIIGGRAGQTFQMSITFHR